MDLLTAINKAFDGTDPDAIKKARRMMIDKTAIKKDKVLDIALTANPEFSGYTKTDEYSWALNKLATVYSTELSTQLIRKVFESGFYSYQNKIPGVAELHFVGYKNTEEYLWAYSMLRKFYTEPLSKEILIKVFVSGFNLSKKQK